LTPEDIGRLRGNEGRIVEMRCSNGEVLFAKILHVDDEHQDVIYDLVRSTAMYPKGKSVAYVIPFADILEFKESLDSPGHL